MAVSIETSVQNGVVAMSIINITFGNDDAAASAAVVIPMCYTAFTTITNICWAAFAMKWGLTDLPSSFTFKELLRSYVNSLSAKRDTNGDFKEKDTDNELDQGP